MARWLTTLAAPDTKPLRPSLADQKLLAGNMNPYDWHTVAEAATHLLKIDDPSDIYTKTLVAGGHRTFDSLHLSLVSLTDKEVKSAIKALGPVAGFRFNPNL